ncbi:hypothetical protein [Modestobacter excelsi]|uniref:hypothetical protein n=1 Tax=Modestobacter excelsi TaxID=2213161 RepID=UPI00110CCA7A|nr:hypothetical protein [Modestobacter excelsi]
MSTFKISASFTETVPAGTAVWFRVQDADLGGALAERYDLRWEVTGPFPTDSVTQAGRQDPTDPALFTMDTDGFRPGAYDVSCRRTLKPTQSPGEHPQPADPGGTDDVDAPADLLAAADRSTLTRAVRAESARGRGDDPDGPPDLAVFRLRVVPPTGSRNQDGIVPVSLQRTSTVPTSDQVLWMIIRNRTEAISFARYKEFIDSVMCGETAPVRGARQALQFRGTGAFELLCRATDAFLMQEMGVITDEVVTGRARMGATDESPGWREIEGLTPEQLALRETTRLGFRPTKQQIADMRADYFEQLRQESGPVMPYLNTIQARLGDIPLKGPMEVPATCYGILRSRISDPLSIELIWSYWHEEAMLVQAMYAILARFQNRTPRHGPDPLARLDIDPLRPLGNLIWGWAQEEYSRLTVVRRSAEYEHEYGLRLTGQALHPPVQTVDRRHKFLASFHNLLFLAHVFFKEDDDTTVIADGFPVLNALRETHLLLAEGAHNQYGDLPSTARAEMLVMEWLLSRPEMREFLGGRVMVPYPEPWMDRVDSLKAMQRWTDVSVTHFRDLGVYGEQILLSIRFGDWSDVNDPQQAANWARYWRPEMQRYTHAYRAATGVDLTSRVDATVPTVLLQRRLLAQRRG